MQNCLNCGHEVNENYCPQCGQATNVRRVTWKSFGVEFIHLLTHAEMGVFGTTWQLVRNPGKLLDEYLGGKRKKYQTPIGYFLLWVTISILLHRLVISQFGFHPVFREGLTFKHAASVDAFIHHGEWFYILIFPLSAAIFYFTLGRKRYTYIETIVITMYSFSFTYVLFVLCYLIGGFILHLNVLHWRFYLFQITLTQAYTLWVCISLFRTKKMKLLPLRILLYMTINAIVVLKFLEFLSDTWVKIAPTLHTF